MTRNSKFNEEFGKALADRMGLNHNSTGDEWQAEGVGSGVMVTMKSFRYFSDKEYAEMSEVASRRALEGSEVGE